MVHKVCEKCPTCQLTKKQHSKYGHLPPKEAESIPWKRLCVDLIGPYKITPKNSKEQKLWCVTMINPATNWFEIKQIKLKDAATVANMVEQTWLTRYPGQSSSNSIEEKNSLPNLQKWSQMITESNKNHHL